MNRITKKLQAAGLPLELVRGEGYCYLVFEEGNKFETRSVCVPRISDLSVESWLLEGRQFVEEARNR